MKKRVIGALLLAITLLAQSIAVYGGSIGYNLEKTEVGKVVEIIDGEVIKVFFFRRNFDVPSIEIVKLIGIDTEANVDAFEYTSNRLLGKSVYFTIEESDSYMPDTMVHANVFYDFDQTVSEELLELGYAKVDTTYKGSEHYHSFLKSEYNAKLYEEGIWATNLSETSDRININTATTLQLQEALDIEQPLANKIYSYRLHNAYNDITEIMAVDKTLNAEWFEEHRHLMSVITNINKASYLELSSLIGNASNAQSIIDDIDHYIRFNEVKDLEALKSIATFKSYYSQVEDFLTLEATNIYEDNHKYVANVNTCSSSSFKTATGLSSSVFEKLESYRDDDYFISTIGELYIYNAVFDKNMRHHYSDHLVAYTDVNAANEFELMSLFDNTDLSSSEKKNIAGEIIDGRPYLLMSQVRNTLGSVNYDTIEPYIYVYTEDIADRYNEYTVPDENVDAMDRKYGGRNAKYTNINRVSENALYDLHPDMTKDLVDAIVEYRDVHYFRYMDDLKEIFEDEQRLPLYNKIDNYIVFE